MSVVVLLERPFARLRSFTTVGEPVARTIRSFKPSIRESEETLKSTSSSSVCLSSVLCRSLCWHRHGARGKTGVGRECCTVARASAVACLPEAGVGAHDVPQRLEACVDEGAEVELLKAELKQKADHGHLQPRFDYPY